MKEDKINEEVKVEESVSEEVIDSSVVEEPVVEEKPINAKAVIANDRKILVRLNKNKDLLEKEISLHEKIFEFQKSHKTLIDGKPSWILEQEYIDLQVELGEVVLVNKLIPKKDDLERVKESIEGIKKEILELERNHIPKLNVGVDNE